MPNFVINEFYKRMNDINFNTYGILDAKNKIHTLGTDSKIIGRIFEMFTQPILEDIAHDHHMVLNTPSSQLSYPDFTLMINTASTEKIAIDIKTTYRENVNGNIKYTLGSYGSYMRNNTKNINFPYTDYSKHYVIGFIYERNAEAQQSFVYDYTNRNEIEFPFQNVKYFIQEKYKIAGDKPGSGNTENIGSIHTKDIGDLIAGNGPFSCLGSDAFELYWKYYPKYRSPEKPYTSLDEFIEWLPNNIGTCELLHPYDKENLINRITAYRKLS